jgi:hypothetical protein
MKFAASFPTYWAAWILVSCVYVNEKKRPPRLPLVTRTAIK